MATNEEDWTTWPHEHDDPAGSAVVYGIGVHPWWADAVKSGWEQRLREALTARPGCLVGEPPLLLHPSPSRQARACPPHNARIDFRTPLQVRSGWTMRRDHRGRASARRRRSEPCSVHNWGSQANSGGRAPCTVSRYVESMVLNVSISSHNGNHTQHSMRNLAAFICPDRAGADQCRNLNPTLAPILIILQAVGTGTFPTTTTTTTA